jgi:N-methylhydantoinase A
MHAHTRSLEEWCASAGIGQLLIMQSNGGALTADRAAANPVRLVRSGPVGGVIAASHIGKLAGLGHVIAADMGGTSFEAGFLPNSEPAFTTREELEHGIPIALPMIDVRAIGAGGGSLARLDEASIMKVGPQSAGADPGPACYGRGGSQPTITDANLVLGRLVPDLPLGGHLRLDVEAAELAVGQLAEQLGVSSFGVAQGIVEIAVHNMAQAMRLVSVDRGHDPRMATLVPYGGAGPLHACELARALQIERILVPRYPGAFSALGALISDTRFDYRQTSWMRPQTLDIERANAIFADLERKAALDFRREGFLDAPLVERSVEMRYVGQNFELAVTMPLGQLTRRDFAHAVARFHSEHEHLYGYAIDNEECEVLNFNLRAIGTQERVPLPRVEPSGTAVPVGETPVSFSGLDRPIPALLYEREELGAGSVLEGPAIVGQLDATTVIEPGARAVVDEYGNLLITFNGWRQL